MGERRIAMAASAGLALCAKERGCFADLAASCESLVSIAGGRERVLHDRWYVEAAYAWNSCINNANGPAAVARLDSALRDLRRRDIDHWLRLELEATRIEEFLFGCVAEKRRARLAIDARSYGALGIARQAASGLANRGAA